MGGMAFLLWVAINCAGLGAGPQQPSNVARTDKKGRALRRAMSAVAERC